jgi:hypothetical protein
MLMSARPNFGYFVCAARGLPMREKETHGISYTKHALQLGPLLDIHEARRTNSLLSETGGYLSVSIVSFLSRFCARREYARARSTLIGNRSMILCHPIDARVASQQHSPLTPRKAKCCSKRRCFCGENSVLFWCDQIAGCCKRVLERSGGGVLCLRANLYIY